VREGKANKGKIVIVKRATVTPHENQDYTFSMMVATSKPCFYTWDNRIGISINRRSNLNNFFI
jgi:hypothetical protein